VDQRGPEERKDRRGTGAAVNALQERHRASGDEEVRRGAPAPARRPLRINIGASAPIRASARAQQAPPVDEIDAVRDGTRANVQVSALIAGAAASRWLDGTLMVWVIERRDGTVWLVDAGGYRAAFPTRGKPVDDRTPSDAVAALGIAADQVTDIIVSHVHWDHADGLDLLPKARVWT